MTTPRAKIWSTTLFNVNLTVAGQGGAKGADLGGQLKANLGILSLAGYTVGPIFIDALAVSDDDNTAVDVFTVHYGIGVFTAGIDDGDFPSMSAGDGDWMFKKDVVLQMPGSAGAIALPAEHGGHLALVTRSMRRLDRVAESLFMVAQQNNANDMVYHFAVSMMWRMP